MTKKGTLQLKNSHITATAPSLLLLFFLLLSSFSFAQQPEQLMEQANSAYREKQYPEAIKVYEQLLAEGYSSMVLHFNLGNAYYQNKQLGNAILHYEKARQVAPGDEDVLFNLRVAAAQQQDEMEDLPAFFLSQWWKALRSRFTSGTWATLGLLLLWGSAAGYIFWLMGKERKHRKRGFILGAVLLVLGVIPFLLAIDRQSYDEHSREAVLLEKEAPLHFAPDADSQVILTIHEGLKMDLQDQISGWYKVRLPNGEVGWLPVTSVAEI